MSLAVTYIDVATVKKFAEDVVYSSKLPRPREILVSEDKSYDGDDVIVVSLNVKGSDKIGEGLDRLKAIKLIQSFVADAGDKRTVFLRYKLMASNDDTGSSRS